MKILYITYDAISDFVSESQIVPYLKRLSGSGILITLLSFEKERDPVGDKDRKLRKTLENKHISWVRKRYHKHPTVPATLFDIFQGVITGIYIVKKEGIDVVHARGYIAALMGCILKRFLKIKIIFDMRGFWPDEKVDAGAWEKGGLLYSVFKRLENYLLLKADYIIVLSDSAKRTILGHFHVKSDIAVIPCGVDLKVFSDKPDVVSGETQGTTMAGDIENKWVILYTGNLGSFYNLNGILDFFCFLKERKKEAFLWIISNYSRDAIRKKALSFGIRAADYRVDTLHYKDMPEAFSRANFSLIFYNRKLSGIGCSPIKLGESLACGVPVVINSGIGDCDRIIRDYDVGAVIEEFSHEEYERAYEKIKALIGDREAVKKRCRKIAEDLFSLDAAVEKYKEIYSKLMM
ncbi:MAG: glycosyltransferase family 4 protein [Candidatus Omnitrophota bacterium]